MLNIKKIKFKILIPVMIIIFLMAFILTYVSINQSGKNIRKETRGKLEHMSTANANNFNTSLESIESKANSIHSLVQSTLDIEDLKNDENYMKNYKQQISPVIKEISETTDGILGAYVFFNPEVVNEAHDIYFVDEENTGNFTKQEELDEEDYNRESEDMSWFYKPYEEGQTVWSDPFYWESLDLDMFSFTRSIEIDGEHIGTVGIDIQFNDIKSRIEEINPYESGYAFLINEENNFIVHPDYNSSDSLSAMGIDNKRETIENNESGVLKYTGDNNESSYLGYKKLTNGWTLGITVPEEEVMAGVKQSRNYLIFISIIIVLIATVIMLYTGNIIAKPITNLSSKIDKFGNGDLTVSFTSKTDDEVGMMAESLQRMGDNLREMIQDVADIAANLSASSEELSASSEEISASAQQVGTAIQEVASGAQEQSAQIDETTDNIDTLTEQIENVKKLSTNMDDQADSVMSNIEKGNKSVETSIEQVNQVNTQTGKVSSQINSLQKLSGEIIDIIELINGISEQTNLLALNAAIEAARAGEAGRGFSVVADEIRELAEESSEATEEIADLIKEIQQNVKAAVAEMESAEEVVDNSVDAIETTDSSFTEINKAAENLKELIEEISDRSLQMTANSQEVNQAVTQIAAVSEESSSNAEEVAASSEEQASSTEEIVNASEELAQMAEKLSETVDQFKM